MEAFEITYFCEKKDVKFTVEILESMYKKYLRLPYTVSFDEFDDDDKDYYEIRCCIFGIIFDQKSLNVFFEHIWNMNNKMFSMYPCIVIATCIYELTYYYTEYVSNLKSFSNDVLEKFPLVFHRQNLELKYKPIFSNDMLNFYFNKEAQQLFSKS